MTGVAPFGGAQAATFHIDFDHGRDEADGLTPATAWKHAPGDPAAKDAPAKTTLRPGDVVSFAANVRYRGAIVVTASGTASAPITFSGEGTDGTAILDGSEPVARVTPCKSSEDCGGAPAWQKLVRIETNTPVTEDSALFTEKGEMRPAQGPDPKDDFYRDEIDNMIEVDGVAMSKGRVGLPHALAAGLASGGGRLALWVKPNRVVYRPILSMDGDVAHFDPSGLEYYTDRPAKAAARDHVSLIDHPGEFVALPGGRAIVAMLPVGVSSVTVASGRGGFAVHGASHLAFRSLGFENMADGGSLAGGIAVLADNGSSNLVVENNRFHDFDMPQGQGPIIMREVSEVRIAGNRIDTVTLGSGMRLSGAHFIVEDNVIRRLGRTGVMLIKVDDATVQRQRHQRHPGRPRQWIVVLSRQPEHPLPGQYGHRGQAAGDLPWGRSAGDPRHQHRLRQQPVHRNTRRPGIADQLGRLDSRREHPQQRDPWGQVGPAAELEG